MKDLSEVQLVNKNDFDNKEKMEEYDKLKIALIENGVDFNEITSDILKEFRVKSEYSTKEFYKISKTKNSEKKILDFIDKAILPVWVKYVVKDKIELNDLNEILNKDVLRTYIAGIYVVIHSKRMQKDLNRLVELVLIEMFYMGIKELKKAGKV